MAVPSPKKKKIKGVRIQGQENLPENKVSIQIFIIQFLRNYLALPLSGTVRPDRMTPNSNDTKQQHEDEPMCLTSIFSYCKSCLFRKNILPSFIRLYCS